MKPISLLAFQRYLHSAAAKDILSSLATALLVVCAGSVSAQTAHFSGTQVAVGNGLSSPSGVAVDAQGNVFIADTGNNRILRVPASDPTCANAGDCTAVGRGFYSPEGVATDSAGNVYVADTGNNRVIKILATDLTCATAADCTTFASGLLQPAALFVDGSGNVFVGQSAAGAVECTTAGSCSSITGQYVTGASYGVALDNNANVYVSDTAHNDIFKVSGADRSCTVNGDCTLLEVPGLHSPAGLVTDVSNNLYVADMGSNRVLKLPVTDQACSTASDCVIVGYGLNAPFGLAIDTSGSLYIADSGHNRVLKTAVGETDFGQVQIGQLSIVRTIYFTFDSAGSLGSSPVTVLTNGSPNLDFTDAGTGTCATNGASKIYQTGDACSVDLVYKPQLPGVRSGVVILSDSSGNVLANAGVEGTGLGPQINFLPGSVRTLTGNLNTPSGVAVDGSGNVYVSQFDQVLEIVATDGVIPASPTIRTLASYNGFYVSALALDASGNLFLDVPARSQIDEIEAVGGSIPAAPSVAVVNVPSGSSPNNSYGLAVDLSGNIFVSNYTGGTVVELLKANQYAATQVASGFSNPMGIAVDGHGNVFVADSGNSQVKELIAVNGTLPASPAIRVLGSGFGALTGLAVDGMGNVYVGQTLGALVTEIVAVDGTIPDSPTVRTLAYGPSPQGVAVDGHGNVFFTDQRNSNLSEIDLADAPSFVFPTATSDGTTDTVDAPQSVQLLNGGNALLFARYLGIFISPGFMQTAGSGTPVDCTTSFSLAAGDQCNLSIEFAPATGSGTVTGTAQLFDDSGDNPASQIIQLTGTAIAEPSIQTQPASQTINRGHTATLSVTATGTSPLAYQWYQGMSPNPNTPVNGATSATFTTPALSATTNYWVQVSNAAGSANSATAVVTVNQPPAINSSPASQTINSGQSATLTVAAAGTAPLAYQWYQGASPSTVAPIAGATTAAFTTPTLAATTSYWVQVTNVAGTANSATAIITVNQPPTIASSPASQTINAGQTTALTVAATGTAPLTYQWYQGISPNTSTPIAGATAAVYTTPTLTATSSYWVQVSNVAGTANSATATVTVNQPPAITSSLASLTINSGQSASLNVVASGTAPLSYQWYQGISPNTSAPIAGATAAGYTTPTLTATSSYWVQVSNVAGTANSATVTVTVDQPPLIASSPASQTINTGSSATLSITATGTAPLTFQWYQGASPNTNAPIAGATAAMYTTPTLTATSGYWVQVSNVAGTANSATSIITVNQPPVCTLSISGTSTALTVVATAACIDPQNQTLSQTIAWGDGTSGTAAATNRHTYAAPGTYSVQLMATDTSGLSGTARAQVTPNQTPVCTTGIAIGTASTYAVSISVSCTDPQNQALSITIDWGDGSVLPATNNAANMHAYAVGGTYSIMASATDMPGLSGDSTGQPVNLLDVAPAIQPGQTAPVSDIVPAQPVMAPATQVTFLCTAVSTVLNGQASTNVLPSQFGITCTSPTITLTTGQTPVNLTIQTTTATVAAANSAAAIKTTFYAAIFPVSGLMLLGLQNLLSKKRRTWSDPLSSSGVLKLCVLGALCVGVASCTQGFTPPPVVATPTGQYFVTLVETVVNPPAPTGFIQSSLIVPLPVSTTTAQ